MFYSIGVLFIWYKRKTTLTASTVGHLHRLITLLKEKQPTLISLLPIFSEFIYPNEFIKPKIIYAVSQQSSTHDKHSKPEMMPRRHTKSNKPTMTAPSTTPNETGPIYNSIVSLQMVKFS